MKSIAIQNSTKKLPPKRDEVKSAVPPSFLKVLALTLLDMPVCKAMNPLSEQEDIVCKQNNLCNSTMG